MPIWRTLSLPKDSPDDSDDPLKDPLACLYPWQLNHRLSSRIISALSAVYPMTLPMIPTIRSRTLSHVSIHGNSTTACHRASSAPHLTHGNSTIACNLTCVFKPHAFHAIIYSHSYFRLHLTSLVMANIVERVCYWHMEMLTTPSIGHDATTTANVRYYYC